MSLLHVVSETCIALTRQLEHMASAQNGSFPHFHRRIEVLKARSGNVQDGTFLDIPRPCFQDLDPAVKVWKGSVLCWGHVTKPEREHKRVGSRSRENSRGQAQLFPTVTFQQNWVLVKGLNNSYHNKETVLYTIDPYYGKLN